MCFSKPKIPAPPAPPPVVTQDDAAVNVAGNRERRRLASLYGRQSTVLTGPQGAASGTGQTAVKTLLGG